MGHRLSPSFEPAPQPQVTAPLAWHCRCWVQVTGQGVSCCQMHSVAEGSQRAEGRAVTETCATAAASLGCCAGQVLLVNESSASTSELLAAAVQAAGRGVLVGEHTFGKGGHMHVYTVWHGALHQSLRHVS